MEHMTSNAHASTFRTNERAAARHEGEPDAVHDQRRHAQARQRTSLAWMVGGVLWAIAGLLYADSGWQFRASSATFLVADAVLAAGIVGLLVLRPHGTSRPAATALLVALAARVVFGIAEVSGLVTGTESSVLLPIAGLLTGASIAAYGALARCATRGLRAAAIASGLYFFVVMMPFAVASGEPAVLALAAWGIPIVTIGLALNSELW
jgi:hypothetical protein